MAAFTTTCGNAKCQRVSPVSVAWATCRGCRDFVCDKCVEAFSLLELEVEDAVLEWFTVQCADCLEGDGLDEHCDKDAAMKCGFDADYERANRLYKEQTGSEL